MTQETGSGAENQSVARAIAILDLLADSPPLGVREVARQLDIAPSIALRLLKTLSRANYLEQSGENARYTIGYRAFRTGNAFLGQSTIHSAAMPELHRLADQHINGFLGVLRDHAVVYLATVPSSGPIALNHRPGAQTYLHSTALGKAILAEYSDAEVKQLLSETPLPKLTPQTKVHIPKLLVELQEVRRLGYALNEDENRVGVYSAGAVVRNADNKAIGALSGGVPSAGLTDKERARVIKLVVDAALSASRKLGASIAGDFAGAGRSFDRSGASSRNAGRVTEPQPRR
ncbi:IclR family transcriptional regulator [Rhodopseudomonas sp. HC1]|uniref:IclR family transcriptional regulator n=1 Tax=Rhodopseudomonas infernalis TaxID=2897386 RepID=UPI001EE98AF4|nr:IclR family transcriptional regulator [Rhodopseudomonas infernalis]MCG6204221.1 IclR family transcriptional regulator [Rhodopseudomonas infernalis]